MNFLKRVFVLFQMLFRKRHKADLIDKIEETYNKLSPASQAKADEMIDKMLQDQKKQ